MDSDTWEYFTAQLGKDPSEEVPGLTADSSNANFEVLVLVVAAAPHLSLSLPLSLSLSYCLSLIRECRLLVIHSHRH